MGGGAGSSYSGGLVNASGASASGRTPGGVAAPGYVAGVGVGGVGNSDGTPSGSGLVTLQACVALSAPAAQPAPSWPCGSNTTPITTAFAYTGAPASYVAPAKTVAVYASLQGGGGGGGRSSTGAGGAFLSGWVGVPFLPPAATNYTVLVGAGGNYSVASSGAQQPGLGGAAKAANDCCSCTGPGAGPAALGVLGAFPSTAQGTYAFLPLAVAGAGGNGGETRRGAPATADGTASFAPIAGNGSCFGAGNNGYPGSSATLAGGGVVGCSTGTVTTAGYTVGNGKQLTLPMALVSGGPGFGCGGAGGGGYFGGGGGGCVVSPSIAAHARAHSH